MTRVMPWNVIGTKNTYNVTSAKDLMKQSGLDWTVSLDDVYAKTDVGLVEVPNRYATVKRDADGVVTPLSIVGSRYRIFQNQEVFECLDILSNTGQATYSSAGELRGGSIVWTVMELPQNISIGDDKHSGYLLARTSHDGSTPFQMTPIITRLGCTNQINAAMMNGKRKGMYYSLRHSTNSVLDIEDIQRTMKLVREDLHSYVTVSSWLRSMPMDTDEFNNFVRKVYPLPAKIEYVDYELLSPAEKRTKSATERNRTNSWLVWNNNTETQENISGTKFAAFQAIVENVDHFSRDSKKQAEKILLGTDNLYKERALHLLGV